MIQHLNFLEEVENRIPLKKSGASPPFPRVFLTWKLLELRFLVGGDSKIGLRGGVDSLITSRVLTTIAPGILKLQYQEELSEGSENLVNELGKERVMAQIHFWRIYGLLGRGPTRCTSGDSCHIMFIYRSVNGSDLVIRLI